MKTETGHFYIIFDKDEYKKLYTKYSEKGYVLDKNIDNKYPYAVYCYYDNKIIALVEIALYKKEYFSNEKFKKLYKKRVRKQKLKRLI